MTDAKALYDSVNSLTQSKVTEKRTGIEIVIIQQRLKAMDSRMRWVNSGQQLADGLTKKQARENFAYNICCNVEFIDWSMMTNSWRTRQ